MPIVTISRQFGAGGSSVAGIVAKELHADVVDKRLIDEVAKRLEMEPSEVEAQEERPRTLMDRLVRSFVALEPGMGVGWSPPYPDPMFDPARAIVQLTEEVIKEVAECGNVVIVGRGGGFVLGDKPNLLRVFLRAPLESRIPVIMARLGISEAEARRKIHETDTNRAAYVRQLYGHDWQDPNSFDVLLNTGCLGYAASAEIILRACREIPASSRSTDASRTR